MTPANEQLLNRIRKVLALTTSPVEGEAQAAAAMLQKLLLEHNLQIADLEQKGQQAATVNEQEMTAEGAGDWRLELADTLAGHFFCYAILNRRDSTFTFVGRPDNIDSLQMLYTWLTGQISLIAKKARLEHIAKTGEEISPIRWHTNFGIGAVRRIGERLEEASEKAQEAQETKALVIHHRSEVSDYLEQTRGFRADGQMTASQKQWADRREKERQAKEEWKARDPEGYYKQYPYEHPDYLAKQLEEQRKNDEAWRKEQDKRDKRQERRRAKRHAEGRYRRERQWTSEDEAKYWNSITAQNSGRQAANDINLEPFVNRGQDHKQIDK